MDAVKDCLLAAVGAGTIVGAVVLISLHGRLVDTIETGFADRESGLAMRAGVRFRIASMTKAIVSTAALALCERNKLRLEDPVTRWLPDFTPALADGSRPEITLHHLLTHSAGLGYCFTEPLDGAFHRLGISDGLDASKRSLKQNLALIAQAPLAYPPGSAWAYSIATDVLGAVLQEVAEESLPEVVRRLVTDPLGLDATSFHAMPDDPLATPYAAQEDGILRMTDPHTLPFFGSEIRYSPSRALDPRAWPSAGTGMIGTAADYLRFIEAIRLGGAPVLTPRTAALMTRNAVGPRMAAIAPGHGFGLGVSILLDPAVAGLAGTPGSWGWGGVYGSHFFVDPAAGLSVVCMTNTAVTGMAGAFPAALREAVYRDMRRTTA
jgi:CubicO group peptidase (beta-lactamase class C family)